MLPNDADAYLDHIATRRSGDSRNDRPVVAWPWRRIAVVSLLVAFIAVTIITRWPLPAMPAGWREIEPGMSRAEVHAVVAEPITDMREVKGFDAAGHAHGFLGIDYYWRLNVYYDERDRVFAVDARTSNDLGAPFDQPMWSRGDTSGY